MDEKNDFIKQVLDELYALDQELKKYEKDLITAINMII